MSDTKTTHLYLRQSLDRTGEGAAVERQEQECRAYAKKHGLKIVEVYTDNDVSATSGVERPAFERLLAANPESILAWHQDRLLRLTKDLERVIELDVPVLTVMAGTLDLSTPAGRAVARTVAAWSQYETEQKGARQRAAHRQRATKGEPWGTTRAFGFKDGNVEHDEREADIVRSMYDDLLADVSQAAIARRLNEDGILSSKGRPWTQGTVRAVLMHPRNAGLRSHTTTDKKTGKRTTEIVGPGIWEPIVDETTWRAAVAKMTSAPRKGGPQRRYILTGLAECGVCGAPMRVGMVGKAKTKVYVCSEGRHVGRNLAALDEYVTALVIERLSRDDALALITRDDTEDLDTLHAEARDAREALDVLAEMLGSGEITPSAFRAGTEKARARLTDVEARMVDSGRADRLGGLVGATDVEAAWEELDIARQRGVVDALMTVRVMPTKRGSRFNPQHIEILWKGDDE